MNSSEGEQLADEYMEQCLPPRYREVYWPMNLRATEMVRTVTPDDIAQREWNLEMLHVLSEIGREFSQEDKVIWTL